VCNVDCTHSARVSRQSIVSIWDNTYKGRCHTGSVSLDLDPQLAAVVSSETRASVLAVLAGSPAPISGYRVAKLAQVQPIKVYRELRRLAEARVVRETRSGRGRLLWELPSGSLREFVASRGRVSWSEEWLANVRRRTSSEDRRFARRLNAAAARRPRPRSIPAGARAILSEMVRPRQKDEILERLGLPTSVRRGRK